MASELQVTTIRGVPTGANANQILVPSGQTLYAPGHVIQVLQLVWPTYQQISVNTYTATGLTQSITPKSASSKILVNISVNSGNSGSNAAENAFALYRGSSLIETYERGIFAYDPGGAQVHVDANIFLSLLDSPNTTSATTYTLYGKTSSGNLRFNDHISSGFGQSTMTLMEIAQ